MRYCMSVFGRSVRNDSTPDASRQSSLSSIMSAREDAWLTRRSILSLVLEQIEMQILPLFIVLAGNQADHAGVVDDLRFITKLSDAIRHAMTPNAATVTITVCPLCFTAIAVSAHATASG